MRNKLLNNMIRPNFKGLPLQLKLLILAQDTPVNLLEFATSAEANIISLAIVLTVVILDILTHVENNAIFVAAILTCQRIAQTKARDIATLYLLAVNHIAVVLDHMVVVLARIIVAHVHHAIVHRPDRIAIDLALAHVTVVGLATLVLVRPIPPNVATIAHGEEVVVLVDPLHLHTVLPVAVLVGVAPVGHTHVAEEIRWTSSRWRISGSFFSTLGCSSCTIMLGPLFIP